MEDQAGGFKTFYQKQEQCIACEREIFTARACRKNIPAHFPYVESDEFVVMPNHIHGIINSARNQGIRGFKIGVKKWATMNNIDFQWQSGFYEHIIRDEKSLRNIRQSCPA